MRYVVCIPDGAADEPLEELGGRTPLEAAAMPNLARLAASGEVGRAATIPDGMPPGSDVGNMAILGYDPGRYHTGRAPIEAAAMGVDLQPGQVAYRCNLVTLDDDSGTMVDFSAHHIATELRRIMEASKEIVRAKAAELGADATQVWLWGQGTRPMLPSFESKWGLTGRLVTAVDLIRGLGVLSGIDPVEVEGATGYYDTNYEGKRDACLASLADRDFFVIHIEASDEAGHNGEADRKVEALENWDRRVIGPLVEALDNLGPWRLMLMPDHATPTVLRTHTPDPVPYLIYDPAHPGPGGVYTESGVANSPPVVAHDLMARFLQRDPAVA